MEGLHMLQPGMIPALVIRALSDNARIRNTKSSLGFDVISEYAHTAARVAVTDHQGASPMEKVRLDGDPRPGLGVGKTGAVLRAAD